MWKGRRRELWPYHERQMVCAFDALNCITPYTFLTSLLRLLVKVLSPPLSLPHSPMYYTPAVQNIYLINMTLAMDDMADITASTGSLLVI